MSSDVRNRGQAYRAKLADKKKKKKKPVAPKPQAPNPYKYEPKPKYSQIREVKLQRYKNFEDTRQQAGMDNPRMPAVPRSFEDDVVQQSDMYFRNTQSLPDPVTLAQILSNKQNAPRSAEQAQAMWDVVNDADEKELPYMQAGDFAQAEEPRTAWDKIWLESGVEAALQSIHSTTGEKLEVKQPSIENIRGTLSYVRHFNQRYNPTSADYVSASNELLKVKSDLHNRVKQLGLKPKWNPKSTDNELGFEIELRKYAFARQVAYAIYGTPEEQAKANKIIAELVKVGIGGSPIDKSARRFGIDVAQFGPMDTIDGLLSVLKTNSTNMDLIRQIAYDSWVYGRPFGQSEEAARTAYANAFGLNRLPQNQVMQYHKDNQTFVDTMQDVGVAMKHAEDWMRGIPVIGGAAAATVGVVNKADYYFSWPLLKVLQGISTFGMVMAEADYGMSYDEYKEKLSQYGGEEAYKKAGGDGTWGDFDWGAITDLSTWSNGWKEAEGRTPITLALESLDIKSDGTIGGASGDIGMLADMGVMVYLGAKVGDPIWQKGIKLGGVGAWKGARTIHKWGHDYYDLRSDFFGNQNGYLLIYSPHSPATKARMKAQNPNWVDPYQPPPTPGVASLRRLDGKGEGVLGRVFTREAAAGDAVKEATDFAFDVNAPKNAATATRGASKVTHGADETARKNPKKALPVSERISIRPFTHTEFDMVEPPIPGLTYFGGKYLLDPLIARFRRFKHGTGLYTADDVYIGAEYAHGKTVRGPSGQAPGKRGITYFEGGPRNPLDMDSDADMDLWAQVFQDVWNHSDEPAELNLGSHLKENFPHYSRIAPFENSGADLQQEVLDLIDEMKKDLKWDEVEADPTQFRERSYHAGTINAQGRISNMEVYAWLSAKLSKTSSFNFTKDWRFLDANSRFDLVQDSLFRRGFDGQVHTEGLQRQIPHKVIVYFSQAITGRFTKKVYKPDAKLIENAKMRLIERLSDKYADSWDTDDPYIFEDFADRVGLKQEARDDLERIFDLMGADDAEVAEVAGRVLQKYMKDDDFVSAGYDGIKANHKNYYFHEFRDVDGDIIKITAEPRDVVHIKGSLKSHYEETGLGPRQLTKEEAYHRYLEQFTEVARQHVENAKIPLEAPTGPVRTAGDVIDDLVYSHMSSAVDDTYGLKHIETDSGAHVGFDVDKDGSLFIKNFYVMDYASPGTGTDVLNEILSLADDYNVPVRLVPQPFKIAGGRAPMSAEALRDWYKKFGFVDDGKGGMVRKPIQKLSGGQAGGITIDLLTGGLLSKWHGKPGAPGSVHKVTPYTPPVWLSTNAELLTKVDNDFAIGRMYGIPESDRAAKELVRQIARSTDQGEIEGLLRKLEDHGIYIDGGSAAGIKGARWALQQKGIGQLGWSRVFTTMTTYGRMQPLDHAADNLLQVGRAANMGVRSGDRGEALRKLNMLARRCWQAEGNAKQNIVDEMWDLIEKNLGPEELAKYKKFERQVYHARGKRYIEKLHRRAYYGKNQNGTPVEGSIVVPADLAKQLDDGVNEALGKFNEVHNSRAKAIEAKIDSLKKNLGGKRGRGVKGSGEITRLEKELALLNRLRDKAIDPDIQRARIEIAKLVSNFGGDEERLRRLSEAIVDATAKAQAHQDAMDVLYTLGKKKRLTAAEEAQWNEAKNLVDSYGSAQPFKMGQYRQGITHRYDPRIFGWFMSGSPIQKFMLTDQALFEPIMRIFKETVMASIAFPLRVNIGDEMFRLIPEGVFARYYQARNIRKEMEAQGLEFDEWDEMIHNSLAGDWESEISADDWRMVLPNEPEYVDALIDDLKAWRNEPIVQRLIASKNPNHGGAGNFPEQLKSIRQFIRYIRDENSELGAELRMFLDDTHRSTERWVTRNGKHVLEKVYNTDAFKEWCDDWQDRLTVISKHPLLRKAMTENVSKDEIVEFMANNENLVDLWPVNAPIKYKNDFWSKSGNPLYTLQYLNLFHYPYQYGTVKMLSYMGGKIKNALFNDRYYTLRKEILERNPNIDVNELHQLCGEAAARYANQAAYSRSTTMFEDMARNMVPFISAYRQFYVYWGRTVLKHPFSMAAFKQFYPDFMEDPFQYASGDWQFLTPSIPFWGPSEEGSSGLWGVMKQNLPSAGFIPAFGGRTLAGALGLDAEQLAKYPGLGSFAKNYAAFKRQGQLWYGVFGTTPWPDALDSIAGDKEKLIAMQANAIMYWAKYGAQETGAIPDLSGSPWWGKATEWLEGISGGNWSPKPVALANEFAKTFAPINTYYSPEILRDKAQWFVEWNQVYNSGDEKAMAAYRASHPWFDKYISYYEVGPKQQWKMRHDPKYAEQMKFWLSHYDYDMVGNQLRSDDWATNAFANGRNFKDDEQLLSYIHNKYTAIYGGIYLPGEGLPTGVKAGSAYPGDIARAKAEEYYKKQTRKVLKWANEVAEAYALKHGWDKEDLMYKFKHPGGKLDDGRYANWGVWNSIIKEKGLNPYEYNVEQLEKDFQYDFGDQMHDNVWKPNDDNINKLAGIVGSIPSKDAIRRMKAENPPVGRGITSRADTKAEILKQMAYHASNKWYYITAEQLELLGIKADPKINVIQMELKKAWEKWHTYKAGSEEYRNARNAYYATQKKMLGGVEGGQAIIGGIAERMEHIPYFNKPKFISIGAGPAADRQLAAWEDYKAVRKREMAKDHPDADKIQAAYEKFIAGEKIGDKDSSQMEFRTLEIGRVRIWHHVLEYASEFRKTLVNSDSDYYKAKGNSVESKFGSKYANALDKFIRQACSVNPMFKKDIDNYFGDHENVGGMLIDWYNY